MTERGRRERGRGPRAPCSSAAIRRIELERKAAALDFAAHTNVRGKHPLVLVASVLVPCVLAYAWIAGLDFATGLSVTFLASGAAACTVALLIDPRAIVSGLCMILTALLVVLMPEYRGLWLVPGPFASYGSLTRVWHQRPRS